MKFKGRFLAVTLFAFLLCLLTSSVFAAELELGGMKLSRSALTILKRFGDPNEIRVGGTMVGGVATAGGPSPTIPSGGGGDDDDSYGKEDSFAAPARSAAPARTVATPVMTRAPRIGPEVTWIYRFPNNRSLEFIVSGDGHIIQIAAFGIGWDEIRTSKGIVLGSTYKDLIFKYGFPETQTINGNNMVIGYPTRDRVVFSLVAKTVVGITIALVD